MTRGAQPASPLPAHPAPPALSPSVWSSLQTAAVDIKLAHSVFALPFALLGAFIARNPARPWREFAGQLALVVLCMVFARTWAMMVNRLADRRFDLRNARTARRAVASGRLSVGRANAIALAAAFLFCAACSLFWFLHGNSLPVLLSLPVLIWIALYSFTKRFTALCHIFLGGALAASPLAAAIAVRPEVLVDFSSVGHAELQGFGAGITLFLISGMVLFWVAGFDIIYALQDLEFDRQTGLSSIPARLGATRAIWTSRAFHALAFILLALAAASDWRFGPIFDSAVGLVGVLLIAEHVVLAVRGKAGLDMAFFTLNGVVSCLLGAAGIADLLIP